MEKTTRTRRPSPLDDMGFSIDELKDWKRQLESVVRDHPVLSAGIAVGAGVLIARMIKDAMDDEGGRKHRRRSRGGLLTSEIGRAVMGSLATMAAAKVQELMMEHAVEEATDDDEPEPPRRRPRKTTAQKTSQRRSPPRKRRPPVEE